MFEILTLNAISNKIFTVFDDNYSVSSDTKNPDAILVRSFKMDDYEIGDNLLAIGRAGAGVNNIPIPRMTEKGIAVFNTPGANANAVKELVICGLLLSARDIIGGSKWADTLDGDVAKAVEKGKKAFGGFEIAGKTLGIIGLGAIGKLVAGAAEALSMKVAGYDPFLSEVAAKGLSEKGIIIKNTPEEIYEIADYITLHVPLTQDTREMINADSIKLMKDGAVVLNMARGELVNVSAVKEALATGKLRKYVVDFPNADCINTPGIIAIPHLGASTEEAEDNCAVMAATELKDYLENGNVTNSVNFPRLSKDREYDERITVVCNAGQSVPQDLEAILADYKYSMKYAEKGSVGYAIIDISGDLCNGDSALMDRLSDLDNVISIRIL